MTHAIDPSLTLRGQQNCPDWCAGSDHLRVSEECAGADPQHFREVGQIGRFEVAIIKPFELGGGAPIIEVNGCDESFSTRYFMALRSIDARSVAAMLIKAADEI